MQHEHPPNSEQGGEEIPAVGMPDPRPVAGEGASSRPDPFSGAEDAAEAERPDLSVVIVTHNVQDLLASCLLSLRGAAEGLGVEVFVVDNASEDGTVAMVREHFPDVELLVSETNLGFARANNRALRRASGRHLMLLNPDTLLREDCLAALVRHLDEHPEAGAVGPKVLDPDGSFQRTSKRGLPTPWASFCRLSGLSRLFPRSRLFNRYELGWLDPDEEHHDIEALYGAAMAVRREADRRVGGLDEDYFMYGEDIAYSDAIRREGWELHYLPDAPVVHIKGESTRRSRVDRDGHFFRAMRIFAKKRFGFGWWKRTAVNLGVGLALAVARVRRAFPWWGPVLLDGLLLWAALRGSAALGALAGQMASAYVPSYGPVAVGLSLAAAAGLYGRRRFNRYLLGGLAAVPFALQVGLAYFLGQPNLWTAVLGVLAGAAAWGALRLWRWLVRPRERHVVVVEGARREGDRDPVARRLQQELEREGVESELLEDPAGVGPRLRQRVRRLRRERKRPLVAVSLRGRRLEHVFGALEREPLRRAMVSFVDESLLWESDPPQGES